MKTLTLMMCLGSLAFAQSVSYGNNPQAGGYAAANGIRIYYEVYGAGEPLLLLHGNGGSIAGHSKRIEYFSKYYKVIAVDSRAHGRSIDTASVLTYEMMASDINAVLESLDVDSAYVWGQSDGAILALLLAMHYPDKVKKAAGFAANLRPDTTAVLPEVAAWASAVFSQVKDRKQKQLFKLMMDHPHIASDDLKKIKVPFLVMAGDRDLIRPEHSLEIFQSIPHAFLFVMPASTHFGVYEHPEWFNTILHDFFKRDFPVKTTLQVFQH